MNRAHRLAAAPIALLAAIASPPAGAQAIERGQAIYHGICIACHGFPPAGGPETVAGDATRIVAAFDKRPPMSSLRGVLSPVDISDVAEYLLTLDPALPPAVPAHDFTDLWWNAAESGWGFTFTQHASAAAFGILFAYDASTSPRWFTLSGGRWVGPQTFVGRFYASTGPGYLQDAFDPAVVTRTQVGAVRLSFADRNQGTLVYTIDGVLRTKAITRLPY